MNRIVIVSLLLLLAWGCGRSPHRGYKTVAPDVYLRLIALGDGDRTVIPGDCVLVRVRVARLGGEPGSLLSTEQWYAAEDLRRGALLHVMKRMHEGDSASVITTAAQVPWNSLARMEEVMPTDTTQVQMELSLRSLRTQAMMQADRERHRRNDPEGYERNLMRVYRERSGEQWEQWGTSDMYYRIIGRATDTVRVKPGAIVHISYTGKRVEDRQVVDHSGHDGKPFVFRFGDPHQVINGMEVAVTLMRQGQTGFFLIPSEMAFGARGVPGVVEPWTPVLYNVRLEKVDHGPPPAALRRRSPG
jgi:FKBP-type peptidyl-prolyl cis-trans isomerase